MMIINSTNVAAAGRSFRGAGGGRGGAGQEGPGGWRRLPAAGGGWRRLPARLAARLAARMAARPRESRAFFLSLSPGTIYNREGSGKLPDRFA